MESPCPRQRFRGQDTGTSWGRAGGQVRAVPRGHPQRSAHPPTALTKGLGQELHHKHFVLPAQLTLRSRNTCSLVPARRQHISLVVNNPPGSSTGLGFTPKGKSCKKTNKNTPNPSVIKRLFVVQQWPGGGSAAAPVGWGQHGLWPRTDPVTHSITSRCPGFHLALVLLLTGPHAGSASAFTALPLPWFVYK